MIRCSRCGTTTIMKKNSGKPSAEYASKLPAHIAEHTLYKILFDCPNCHYHKEQVFLMESNRDIMFKHFKKLLNKLAECEYSDSIKDGFVSIW
jgi:hypothetical protein